MMLARQVLDSAVFCVLSCLLLSLFQTFLFTSEHFTKFKREAINPRSLVFFIFLKRGLTWSAPLDHHEI